MRVVHGILLRDAWTIEQDAGMTSAEEGIGRMRTSYVTSRRALALCGLGSDELSGDQKRGVYLINTL